MGLRFHRDAFAFVTKPFTRYHYDVWYGVGTVRPNVPIRVGDVYSIEGKPGTHTIDQDVFDATTSSNGDL